ncbi:MAG: hypothetical protein JHC98_03805 [Thermoleophilaceae bacterium]|nr:hypothetical protein [Thermoleophilaceae bacterium]
MAKLTDVMRFFSVPSKPVTRSELLALSDGERDELRTLVGDELNTEAANAA